MTGFQLTLIVNKESIVLCIVLEYKENIAKLASSHDDDAVFDFKFGDLSQSITKRGHNWHICECVYL